MEKKFNQLKLKKDFQHYRNLNDWLQNHSGRNIDLDRAVEELFESAIETTENKKDSGST